MAARYRHPTGPSPTGPPPPPPPPSDTRASAPPAAAKPEPEIVKLKHEYDKELQTDPAKQGVSVLDVLRVLGGIVLLSCGMSYLTSSGESMTWGYNPWWTRAREWKGLWNPTVSLTDTQLLAYDGTDPTKPIYLALNGTIYDVSISPGTYGPGGSYHFFAGRDAARAFLTGCFQEDQTPDLRGVEWMYIPKDPEPSDPSSTSTTDVDAPTPTPTPLTKSQIKNRHAAELRKARKQVRDGLEHWHKLFRGEKGKAYRKVGEVRREKGWLGKLPRRKLCEQAEKGRPVRKASGEADE
ncbi:hypothetical protein P154DRAFT_495451 [Amniculicola lignicola CBS 123094]|uniref:Cytochrome b5 heme-binding domain-containing protein n=1 Tax=Amniculicola lignicola CBS 123094 TaxID=1392246 RepID=A0A6A5W933_9PLEO|nr:hypothetical protein P154DRAFT_495451 [Amniculicola lignicola CBS 123094]